MAGPSKALPKPANGIAKVISLLTWFLTATLARLQGAYASLEFVLPQGVIHGDASVGNVMRDRQGAPVLIDLDGFAVGPREWDLVLTSILHGCDVLA